MNRTSTNASAPRWRSCAKWHPDLHIPGNLSTDEHDTKDQALAVSRRLRLDGLGGDSLKLPLRTWIEMIPAR